MTAADVGRDADLLPLYKAAGVDYVVMGVESLDDAVVAAVGTNNPFGISQDAVRLLRKHDIISLVNIIYGLEDERWGTLLAKFRKRLMLDPDILNAVYLTLHFWTSAGEATDARDIIQPDLTRWSYRTQVVAAPHLAPVELFIGIKLTEALFHLRPRALARLVASGDQRTRRIMRASLLVGVKVIAAEIAEYLWATQFTPRGSLQQLPGDLCQSPV